MKLEVIPLLLCIFYLNVGHTIRYRKFPENFMFGTATASYQVEGGWNASGKGENIWDRLTHTTTYVEDGSTGDVSCDSYNQYKRDVEMLVELGVDFYRFSLSWARILPEGFANNINEDGIRYYNNLIDELLAHNIQPAVTLYHWDLPQRLQDIGGWTNPFLAEYFSDYAKIAFDRFGDRVKTWVTFNEPINTCYEGYGAKESAPAVDINGVGDYLCSHTILKAHAKVYHMYDEVYRPKQKGRISLTVVANWHEPEDNSTEAAVGAENARQLAIGWFCNPIFSQEGDYPKLMKERIGNKSAIQGYPVSRLPQFTPDEIKYIKGTYDYFGMNHYTTYLAKPTTTTTDKKPSFLDDCGIVDYQIDSWPASASSWLRVVPWGIRKSLNWIKNTYNNPEILILENGFSDRGGLNDSDRIDYFRLYLNAILDGIDDGCNVTAYTAWSLMDNFEWLGGYKEKYGLFSVNFNDINRVRTPKLSVSYLSNIFKTKTVEKIRKTRRRVVRI